MSEIQDTRPKAMIEAHQRAVWKSLFNKPSRNADTFLRRFSWEDPNSTIRGTAKKESNT